MMDCTAIQYFTKMYMTRAASRVEDLVVHRGWNEM